MRDLIEKTVHPIQQAYRKNSRLTGVIKTFEPLSEHYFDHLMGTSQNPLAEIPSS
jgi:hypothetical protein